MSQQAGDPGEQMMKLPSEASGLEPQEELMFQGKKADAPVQRQSGRKNPLLFWEVSAF